MEEAPPGRRIPRGAVPEEPSTPTAGPSKMSDEPIPTTLEAVRRLAITKQRLSGPVPSEPSADAIVSVVRDLAYVQWDPVSIVAPSHLISLWSRLGDVRPAELERLMWKERRLFLHWIPFAAIVRTEDYPIFHSLMVRYPDSLSDSWGAQRAEAKRFIAGHRELKKRVLRDLRGGPRTMAQFQDHSRTRRNDGDWAPGSDVEEMLFHLLMSGSVMVVGHEGAQNLWGLAEEFLPEWVDRARLSEEEADGLAAERAVRALGTATPPELKRHFVRGCYRDVRGLLARLERESKVRRVAVEGLKERDGRYVHAEDVPLLESLRTTEREPRVSLLPPFDNLLYDIGRTRRLFGFDYVREQFLPKEKRRYGTYVLPILWGDRLIGRIDPRFDKERAELVLNAVHAEPDAPEGRDVGRAVADTILRFGTFLGADRVSYPSKVPPIWKSALRG